MYLLEYWTYLFPQKTCMYQATDARFTYCSTCIYLIMARRFLYGLFNKKKMHFNTDIGIYDIQNQWYFCTEAKFSFTYCRKLIYSNLWTWSSLLSKSADSPIVIFQILFISFYGVTYQPHFVFILWFHFLCD